MSFGEKLKNLRRERNWTQDQLGEIVGLHGRYISKYENGQVMPSGAEVLKRIANCFNVSIDYLLSEDSEENSGKIKDKVLLKEFQMVDQMDEEDKFVITTLINAFIKKKQLVEFLKKDIPPTFSTSHSMNDRVKI